MVISPEFLRSHQSRIADGPYLMTPLARNVVQRSAQPEGEPKRGGSGTPSPPAPLRPLICGGVRRRIYPQVRRMGAEPDATHRRVRHGPSRLDSLCGGGARRVRTSQWVMPTL